jgi:hypothetical protein
MMTYQQHAITAEAILTDSTMLTRRGFTEWGFTNPGFIDPELRTRQPGSRPSRRRGTTRVTPDRRMPLVLVLEDGQEISAEMQEICDFLEISVGRVNSYEECCRYCSDAGRWRSLPPWMSSDRMAATF